MRGGRRTWPHEKLWLLRFFWLRGDDITRIAEAFGVTYSTIKMRAKRMGIGPHPRKWKKPTSDALHEAVRLVREGMKPDAAAEIAGANLASLRVTLSHLKHGRRDRMKDRAA